MAASPVATPTILCRSPDGRDCRRSQAKQIIAGQGVRFPVGPNPLRLNSPCHLFVKPGFLAVCFAPHQYLLGAAFLPPVCIRWQLRPKDASPAVYGRWSYGPTRPPCSFQSSRLVAHGRNRPMATAAGTGSCRCPPVVPVAGAVVFPVGGQRGAERVTWIAITSHRLLQAPADRPGGSWRQPVARPPASGVAACLGSLRR